ncbi:MAG TPA: peptidase [Acidobacteria bacterium]|jgi:hypothetical protein|nr:peptidase [Acidobacteriota bacterium]|tara:strand:- start:3093 stop:5624 length:2532 start_codon:yes stop_codon:yes gene_type:complete
MGPMSIPTVPRILLVAVLAWTAMAAPTYAQLPSIEQQTTGLQQLGGYVPLHWDANEGRLYLEIDRFDTELLYQVGLTTGVGSNPLGLDRGRLGATRVVHFERIGPRVLMVEPNYRYRAITSDVDERRAVEESFARSVTWGFEVAAATGPRVLVDATAFFLRDANSIAEQLRQLDQGRFRLDLGRSAIHLERTQGFPENTEVEATLTFVAEDGTDPGELLNRTAPSPRALTVRQHHSFVELPDPSERNYRPRRADPRVSAMAVEFHDYATPITEPVERRWILRHHLEKRDPAARVSEPVEPIVYYLDRGVPEPIRSALLEGTSWWNDAFEAAGFRDAFQVRLLPAGADPMDVRYNMIHWVHRSTRGWSYGSQVVDPRTGEILKGNVRLGSLRARQDHLIGAGLAPPYGAADRADAWCSVGLTPDTAYLQPLDPTVDPEAMALARLRQLAAHEVGHAIGFAHNFAASTYGRASVMDYPAPLAQIRNGRIDLSDAYADGIGEFDLFAVTYAYAQFAPGTDEAAALERVIDEGISRGMLFLTDADARPAGTAHPLANLWDNGDDPVAMLRHEMDVRRIGLGQFGLRNIPIGAPLSTLEAQLLPLYLHHRYQLAAAAKTLGGVAYTYAVRTPTGPSPTSVYEIVSAVRQRDALDAVLDTIAAEELALPAALLDLIPPRAFQSDGGTAEPFDRRTAMVFDPISAAMTAADLAVSALLQPERAARLVDFHARDAEYPGFEEVVEALLARTWRALPPGAAHAAAIMQAVERLVVTRLMQVAAAEDASAQVRAIASDALRELAASLDTAASAHDQAARDDIRRFLERPDASYAPTRPFPPPAGDPIGSSAAP